MNIRTFSKPSIKQFSKEIKLSKSRYNPNRIYLYKDDEDEEIYWSSEREITDNGREFDPLPVKELYGSFENWNELDKFLGVTDKLPRGKALDKFVKSHSKADLNQSTKQFSKPLVKPVTSPDSIAQKPKVNTNIYFNTARLDESLNSMRNLFK